MKESKIYKEYMNVPLDELNNWVRVGYELIEVVYEEWIDTSYYISGSIMNNTINFNTPLVRRNPKAFLGRTNAAKLLYDESLKLEKSI